MSEIIKDQREEKYSSMSFVPHTDMNSPLKIVRNKRINQVQSMIDLDKYKEQYIKKLIVDKNLIDISPQITHSKAIQNSYYINPNFTDALNTQMQPNVKKSQQSLLFKQIQRHQFPERGVFSKNLFLQSSKTIKNIGKSVPPSIQQSMYNILLDQSHTPTKVEESYLKETNNKQSRMSSIILNNDNDSIFYQGRGSYKAPSPEKDMLITRSKLKKTSLQLPSVSSPINKKEMVYLSNSKSTRSKTIEKIDDKLSNNPFLPNITQRKQNKLNISIQGASRRSSNKEDSQFDLGLSSQQQIDLFNIILNSSKNITIPQIATGTNLQNNSKFNSLKQIFNQRSASQPLIDEQNSPQVNSPVSSEKSKHLLEKSALNNYSNSQLRENIIKELSLTLAQCIKQNKELNEASYDFQNFQTKNDYQNSEVKVLGYQIRKEQIVEQYQQNKGNDRIQNFANYLSKFSGYIMDLLFGDIPKITKGEVEFEIQLTEQVQDIILPIILEKLKEFGMKDLIERYQLVFKNEYQNMIIKTPIIQENQIEEAAESITQELLARLKLHFQKSFTMYASTCKDLIKDILSEGVSKEKIKDYMEFLRMHLKRSSIFEQPQNKNINTLNHQNKSEQHKGIVESGNYKELLSISSADLFFIKKTIYEVLKKQCPNLSLTSRARILEKVESLRFGYFKEVYSLNEKSNQQLIEIMKVYVSNSPPLLAYLKRPESSKQITKLLTILLDSILGDCSLQHFVEKSSILLNQELDLPLISMLEQGVKGSLAQLQINIVLIKEIEYKFTNLKRRVRLTPPFNAVFYQIDSIIKYMNSWIDLMAQQKQIKIDNQQELLSQLKQIDFLEFFLVCSLSDFDTFSFIDLQDGLKYFKVRKEVFKFWLKGIKRIFAKLKLKQKEINLIDDYFQKAFNNTQF
ncbi:tubulin-tyrosine ligase family protein (macronuclear) [Tetrahymena thermophila SB210]|uniref:Tubulin-tyrosine ligase family protein n=1 Tax=Tetrahymena thermophila (strain SB210) TaxID=312017 RepID=Q22BT7_TETTS|nr:tubulin-tyrosine ligase family protein [Tetrahymena thermophila SB210]EAR82763.2 tubulin-tyrosine ligase family protein [Tetrahymena thermophila SB210]|eukprot:XP_001030426.2 tubulin-tyrosine ligase family protein [Tetrahymena thermophila SB210]